MIVVWCEAPLTVYLLRFPALPSVTDFSVPAAPMPEALRESALMQYRRTMVSDGNGRLAINVAVFIKGGRCDEC